MHWKIILETCLWEQVWLCLLFLHAQHKRTTYIKCHLHGNIVCEISQEMLRKQNPSSSSSLQYVGGCAQQSYGGLHTVSNPALQSVMEDKERKIYWHDARANTHLHTDCTHISVSHYYISLVLKCAAVGKAREVNQKWI